MSKLIVVLSVTLGSVLLGYLLRRFSVFTSRGGVDHAPRISRDIKLISMFVLNPIPVLDSFWRLPLSSGVLYLLPLLGLLSLAVGAVGALAVNRLFHIPPQRAASVFVAAMFTNIVSFGGLTAYVFFGYEAYGLVMLINMFVSFTYYAVGFPISERIAAGAQNPFAISPRLLLERPYLLIPILSMAAGVILNVTGAPQLHWLNILSSVLIVLVSAILGLSIGLTLWFSRLKEYRFEVFLVAIIKFALVPLVLVPVGLLVGLPSVMGGLPFRVLCIVAFMPVAFNALVPPALYGFDLDLANSAWIVTTGALVVLLPVMFFTLV